MASFPDLNWLEVPARDHIIPPISNQNQNPKGNDKDSDSDSSIQKIDSSESESSISSEEDEEEEDLSEEDNEVSPGSSPEDSRIVAPEPVPKGTGRGKQWEDQPLSILW